MSISSKNIEESCVLVLRKCLCYIEDYGIILTLFHVSKRIRKFMVEESKVYSSVYFRSGPCGSGDHEINKWSQNVLMGSARSDISKCCEKLVVGTRDQFGNARKGDKKMLVKDENSRFYEYYVFYTYNRQLQFHGRLKMGDWYECSLLDLSLFLDQFENITHLCVCRGLSLQLGRSFRLKKIRSLQLFEVSVHLTKEYEQIRELSLHDCRIYAEEGFLFSPSLESYTVTYGGSLFNNYLVHPKLKDVYMCSTMKEVKRTIGPGPEPSFQDFCTNFTLAFELKDSFQISERVPSLVTYALTSNTMKNLRKLELRKIYHPGRTIDGGDWTGLLKLEEVTFELIPVSDSFFQSNEFQCLRELYLIGTCTEGLGWKPMPVLQKLVICQQAVRIDDSFFLLNKSFSKTIEHLGLFGRIGEYYSSPNDSLFYGGVDKNSIISHSSEKVKELRFILPLADSIPNDQVFDFNETWFPNIRNIQMKYVKVAGWEAFISKSTKLESLELSQVIFGYFTQLRTQNLTRGPLMNVGVMKFPPPF